MIFLTVGSEGCDRLVKAVTHWSSNSANNEELIAQIADGHFEPQAFRCVRFLTPHDYSELFLRARLIVSHAGMGTIITALEMRKPIVVLPRRAMYGETRNDHQLATAERFQRSDQVIVANTEADLPVAIDGALSRGSTKTPMDDMGCNWPVDAQLLQFVRQFVGSPSPDSR